MSKPFIISCHQPNFLPYLGFFDKMEKSDVFVIRNEVLFVKKEYHNRNRIRINSHSPEVPLSKWISVPVENTNDFIKHVTIKKETKMKGKYWNEIILHDIKTSYSKTPHFEEHFPSVEKIFDNSHDKLLDLNVDVIKFLTKTFGIKTKIIFASELKLKKDNYEKSDASEDLANICSVLNGDIYLSGAGGREYLNQEPFLKKNISVEFQDYEHPVYPTPYDKFLPYMSAIEALFCCNSLPRAMVNQVIPPVEIENKIPQIVLN